MESCVNKLEVGKVVVRFLDLEDGQALIGNAVKITEVDDDFVKFDFMPTYSSMDEDYMFKPNEEGVSMYFVAPTWLEEYRQDKWFYSVPIDKLKEYIQTYVSIFGKSTLRSSANLPKSSALFG